MIDFKKKYGAALSSGRGGLSLQRAGVEEAVGEILRP